MLETIKNAFKTKEIRNKLLFVFFGLIIVRIGCNIPLPGVNTNVIQNLFDNNQALNFLDVMTGGSFTRMSIFALNITPYITASIIVQLLTIAIPRLEELQKDGEDGRKKINEYTRYLSIVLALIEGLAIVIGFRNQGFFTESGYTSVIISVVDQQDNGNTISNTFFCNFLTKPHKECSSCRQNSWKWRINQKAHS